jgi:ABC-type multidrug transport system ATPase subunit
MSQGEIVYNGTPTDAVSQLKGKVWQKQIEREELDSHQKQYQVISDKMVAGKPIIHIYNEENPMNGFTSITPNLEDVFFVKTKLNLVHETV